MASENTVKSSAPSQSCVIPAFFQSDQSPFGDDANQESNGREKWDSFVYTVSFSAQRQSNEKEILSKQIVSSWWFFAFFRSA